MLSTKLAALCLCPVLAGPVVLATQPKARHAVAHLLHHAANRLENPVVAVVEPAPLGHCPASYASDAPGSNGLSSPIPEGITGLLPQDLSALQGGNPDSNGIGGFSAGPVSGFAPKNGIGGSSFGTVPATNEPGGTGGVTTPTPTEGVTEPQNWALLVTGFAVTGLLLRNRQPKTA